MLLELAVIGGAARCAENGEGNVGGFNDEDVGRELDLAAAAVIGLKVVEEEVALVVLGVVVMVIAEVIEGAMPVLLLVLEVVLLLTPAVGADEEVNEEAVVLLLLPRSARPCLSSLYLLDKTSSRFIFPMVASDGEAVCAYIYMCVCVC